MQFLYTFLLFWLVLSCYSSAQSRIGITQRPESEVHVAISPTDSSYMLASCMRYNPFGQGDKLDFTIYRTHNFGQSWQESTFRGIISGNNSIAGGGDPLVAIETSEISHFIWLLLTVNSATFQGKIGIYHASSMDQGISWNTRTNPIASGTLSVQPGSNEVVATDRYVDKPWLAIDHSNSSFRDQLYVVYYQLQVSPDTIPSIQCVRKGRNQANFALSPVQVNSRSYKELQFTSADVDGQGHLHVSFYGTEDGHHYNIYHTKSTDGGNSFKAETIISPLIFPQADSIGIFPPSDVVGVERLYPCPHIKADKSDGPLAGSLYASWTAKGIDSMNMSKGFDIYFSRSKDGGTSWSPPQIVNDDPNPDLHQFYPSLEVNPRGIVMLAWYDRRKDPNNVLTDYYFTYSTDGGKNWKPQVALTSSQADFSHIGDDNADFGVGEYTAMVSTSNMAIPFWADGRENNGRVRLYGAQVELSGEVTALDRLFQLNGNLRIVNIFPQPAEKQLQIELEIKQAGEWELGLYDLSGKEVKKNPEQYLGPGIHRLVIYLENVAPGAYFVMARGVEGRIMKKIWMR